MPLKYKFCWPQPNGDVPTSTIIVADDLPSALREILGRYGSTLHGCTVCEGEFPYDRTLGSLLVVWNGPNIFIDKVPVLLIHRSATHWNHMQWNTAPGWEKIYQKNS